MRVTIARLRQTRLASPGRDRKWCNRSTRNGCGRQQLLCDRHGAERCQHVNRCLNEALLLVEHDNDERCSYAEWQLSSAFAGSRCHFNRHCDRNRPGCRSVIKTGPLLPFLGGRTSQRSTISAHARYCRIARTNPDSTQPSPSTVSHNKSYFCHASKQLNRDSNHRFSRDGRVQMDVSEHLA